MKASRRPAKEPWPWHLVLAPTLPILALYNANAGQVAGLSAVLWPVSAAVAVALCLWGLLILVFRDSKSAALATTVLVLSVLSYVAILRAFAPLQFRFAVPITYAVLIGMAGSLWRMRGRTAWLTSSANMVAVLAVAITTGQIVANAWRSPGVSPVSVETQVESRGGVLPDVYVMILDGYGRADVLRERYGLDNGLVPALRPLGFAVADGASSNYSQTALSLASALNLDYLQTLLANSARPSPSRRDLARLIARNRFFEYFREAGYWIRSYKSEYELLRPGPVDERRGPLGFTDSFGYTAYEMSAVPTLLTVLGLPRSSAPLQLHRRQVRWTLDDLSSDESPADGPKLVFAHLLAPHPPFAFNPDGTARETPLPALLNDGNHWRAMARGSGQSYEAGYADNVRFLDAAVLRVVRHVLQTATRPTVFYIQGDHGPGGGLEWESPEDTDMRERHGILLALRLPSDGARPPFSDDITPVNAFRLVVNEALGAHLPQLDDRSYFATWSDPFDFVDVTDRVQPYHSH